ncbi:MAG TPA: radical SAM protein [Anaerolineae bacterium]|nr:radical SAM protein [Anaerolineae bacterium]HQK14673.1 radical SAM protein [Anaerolineae bacterium]
MKVLLINPPSEQELIGNNPAIIEEERGHNPPLGLLYVAAYLESHAAQEHEVAIIDAQVEELSYAQLAERIEQYAPDIVGLTAMTFTLLDVIHTIQVVKAHAPHARVVVGGPHAHLYPEETLNLPGVDFVVVGEGEEVFHQLVQHIDHPEDLMKVHGLVFRHEGQIVKTAYAGLIQDLDSLPFPARHLTPYKKYSSLLARRNPITTMFTSRGCPFRCAFCDRPHLGKRFRARSPKNVVDEMAACVNMGIYEFLIYDDTFTVDRKRVLGICEEIQQRKLDIGWDIRARVDTVDEHLLKTLRAAGCERIHYGVEAGTEKILKVLNKGITLTQVQNVFKWTKQAGIETLAYFMIGSPTETREDILQTIRFAERLDPDYVHITILTPFPGTQIYFDGLAQGVFTEDFWQKFAANPTPDFVPRYWEQELSTDELITILNQAYKRFYLRPRYVWKRLTRVRSLRELVRKAHAGVKVLRL